VSLFTKRKCPECGAWVEKGHQCGGAIDLEAMPHDERWGYLMATLGETACPYAKSQEVQYRSWHRGYDIAERAGLAKLRRFRDTAGRRSWARD
jgi:hypothetical protein